MKPGRNDPCPCGSGRKYKQCCLAQDGRKVDVVIAAPNLMQLPIQYVAREQGVRL